MRVGFVPPTWHLAIGARALSTRGCSGASLALGWELPLDGAEWCQGVVNVFRHQDTFEVGEYDTNIGHRRVEDVGAMDLLEVSVEIMGIDDIGTTSAISSVGTLVAIVCGGCGCGLLFLGPAPFAILITLVA